MCCGTVRLKFRWPNFQTVTRQITLPRPAASDDEIYAAVLQLFEKLWKPGQAVRLLGVGATRLSPTEAAGSSHHQLTFWNELTDDG
jgi:DNA polymerase-4